MPAMAGETPSPLPEAGVEAPKRQITGDGKGNWVLEWEQFVPLPLEKTFAFFGQAENLQRITPGFINFRMLTPTPIEMKRGCIIEYRIRINLVPVYWRTLISEYEPPHRFVDVQQKGPYARWVHEHRFEQVAGGTMMRDRVDYRLPLGPLGLLAHSLFVRRQLFSIWRYRTERITELLAEPPQE